LHFDSLRKPKGASGKGAPFFAAYFLIFQKKRGGIKNASEVLSGLPGNPFFQFFSYFYYCNE